MTINFDEDLIEIAYVEQILYNDKDEEGRYLYHIDVHALLYWPTSNRDIRTEMVTVFSGNKDQLAHLLKEDQEVRVVHESDPHQTTMKTIQFKDLW